ncbi:MAG: hypothetical protein QOK40_3128 [Miltoncostaeaceae bacterium]|nr:hypothetical protein [Miltoncostaeaceae bacterium]
MEWLLRGWDTPQILALAVGLGAGITLVVFGLSGYAELAGTACAVIARWAMWQIPPPGRSAAPGRPPDGLSRLGQLAVTVLLVTLSLEVVLAPLR